MPRRPQKLATGPLTSEQEQPLQVTVKGPEDETPDRWADLVEFVLTAVRRRERRKRDERHDDNAA
jgi:hypothetical protein